MSDSVKDRTLKPYVSRSGAFALSVGTSIGWGSLVVSNNEYLAQAGPVGSCLGILLGMLVMLVLAANFCNMAEKYPDSGGIYSYVKGAFGYDRAFLVSWFLGLTYMAIYWANATSIPLFARYFLGNLFCFGHLYTLFGYEVYAGEILLTLAVTIAFTLLCMRASRPAQVLVIGMVLLIIAGLGICFAAALFGGGVSAGSLEPSFVPGVSVIRQLLKIAFISPWAFIGFESITHSAEEFAFPGKELKKIFPAAIVVTTVLYMAVFLLSVTAYPPEYDSWLAYIRDLDSLSGIEALPAFYAAYRYMGQTGIVILMIVLLCLVFSSLIGNMTALSRLFYSMARDRILPAYFAVLSERGIPVRAAGLVLLVSLPIFFIGRKPVGWIVDITTIGATLLYGFISAAALRSARKEGDRPGCVTGAAGLVLMLLFGVYIVYESLSGSGALSRESQLILIVWSVLGLLYFRSVMARDHGKRFGKNLTVWIVLVAFIFVLAMLWICEESMQIMSEELVRVRNHYAGGAEITGIAEDTYLQYCRRELMKILLGGGAGVIGVFVVSIGTMLANWRFARKCEEETRQELGSVKNMAYRDPLTGVKSKHAFAEKEEEMDDAITQHSAGDFAVIVFDVNGLKHINDTLGHKAGDAYIKEASVLICITFDHSPVFRTGGDEFVALLNGRDYPNRKELLEAFDRQVEENIKTGQVVISAGIADFDPGQDTDFHAVFERADKLMYERKQKLKAMGARTRE